MPLLELTAVRAGYGPRPVLHAIDLFVDAGEMVALLGANGAGKTTTLRAISGTVDRSGTLRFADRSLLGYSPADTARAGIAHVPEGRGTMAQLTVLENLMLGAYVRRDREIGVDLERVFTYFPVLKERRAQDAGTLSGGEQQMLAIGRAVMARPRLMLLDEPSLGLAPMVAQRIFEIVRMLNSELGTAVVLVEQNAVAALDIVQRAYVLEAGRIVVSGTSAELQADDSVRRSYLGY